MKTHLADAVRYAFFTVLVVFSAAASQERSDFQIVQGFQREYRAIQKATEAAATVEDCASIFQRISEVEAEYGPHKQFLNKALYPDGFDKRLADARLQLRLTQDKLGVIEAQVKRIAELRMQVDLLGEQVEKLSGENVNLLKQVQRMSASRSKETIDSLQNLVARLRTQIQQRDQLIFALVDSLFLQYDKDMGSMTDVERKSLTGRLEKGNVFTNVKRSIRDNIEFLESTSLTGRDVAEIAKQQRRFEIQWEGFGKKLAVLYATNKRAMKEVTQIDTMLAEWGRKTQTLFWRQLNLQFRDRGYAVNEFASGKEFYENLSEFIEDEIKNVHHEADDTRYRRYVIFSDSIWNNDVRPNWLPLLVERGELSDSLSEELEGRINSWRKTVQPPSTILYILVGLVLGLIAWFAYKRMQKRRAATPTAPAN
ncbi:MAG: hypothetical protein HY562_01370 [Ignavibacteriales bacterium]|nr:hypothetical protein [Ignavibacteriales bacterium]